MLWRSRSRPCLILTWLFRGLIDRSPQTSWDLPRHHGQVRSYQVLNELRGMASFRKLTPGSGEGPVLPLHHIPTFGSYPPASPWMISPQVFTQGLARTVSDAIRAVPFLRSGSRTRTGDLQIMSLPSYQLLYPAMRLVLNVVQAPRHFGLPPCVGIVGVAPTSAHVPNVVARSEPLSRVLVRPGSHPGFPTCSVRTNKEDTTHVEVVCQLPAHQ